MGNLFLSNEFMDNLPRHKASSKKKPLNVKVDEEIDELYRTGRQNGWDVSEIARRAITEVFERVAEQLKRPAS